MTREWEHLRKSFCRAKGVRVENSRDVSANTSAEALVNEIRRETARWAQTKAVRKILLRGVDVRRKPKPA